MKQTSTKKRIPLIIGLILILALLFTNSKLINSNQQSDGNTNIPVIPSIDTSLTSTYIASLPKFPTVAQSPTVPVVFTATSTLQPPQCTFPLVNVKYPESKQEEYIFSEPHVVLTVPEGNHLNVAQWLPDNQQVLVVEDLRNQYVESNDTTVQESISLYNIQTGESKLYATRVITGEPPVWQPHVNGVVYSSANYTKIDKLHGAYQSAPQLWISYGDSGTAQLLAEKLSQNTLLLKPDGSEILYFLDKQIAKLDGILNKLPVISFDPTQWDYAKEGRDDKPVSYHMVWQPGTSLVFLYSSAGGTSAGGYTFILDTTNGHICNLNLGGWASRAHWSSDGRYLAIASPSSYTGISDIIKLVVLDSTTGNLRTVEVVPQDLKGNHDVSDFTWTPDNLHLLVLEDIPSTYDPYRYETIHHELYLVDFISNQSLQLFPEYKSFIAGGAPSNNFVWSPDYSKLLVRCPIIKMPTKGIDRFCLISVQENGQ
ncbi:MAG: hypothetical protein U0Z26_05330 [Anaerolineales bacterium]